MQRFRKVDPDRWEFANEGFLRGQKHLLKGINRRKTANVPHHPQPQQPHMQTPPVGSCVEIGKFGLEEEIEWLKRDKNVLTQELVRLRQQQQSTEGEMQTMVQRLQGMEQRQQQMMSFLSKAVNIPGFLAQFVQQQNDNNSIAEGSKKRRLKQEDDGVLEEGHMIRYQQPLMDEAVSAEEALFRQIMKHEDVTSSSSSSGTVDYGGGSRLSSQHHLHEVVFPSDVISEVDQSSSLDSISEPILLFPSAAAGGGEGLGLGLGLGSGSVPDNDICISSEVPVELLMSNICHEGEIEWENPLLQKLPSIGDPFWEELIASGPILPPDDSTDSSSTEEDMLEMNRNSSTGQKKMEQLTEQMGLLSSNTIIANRRL